MMCHHNQATTSFLVKKNLEDNFCTTIHDLNNHLNQFPSEKISNHLMCLGSSLRETRSFWHKSRNELTYMISQLGCPTLFFTLSATDTKWPDLHVIMPDTPPHDATKQQQ